MEGKWKPRGRGAGPRGSPAHDAYRLRHHTLRSSPSICSSNERRWAHPRLNPGRRVAAPPPAAATRRRCATQCMSPGLLVARARARCAAETCGPATRCAAARPASSPADAATPRAAPPRGAGPMRRETGC